MYKQLLEYMKNKPKEYEANSQMLWDDEHISKRMLEAHLNPNIDTASRKYEFINRSVKWISSLCRSNQQKYLLDLGCGPGLYAEKFDDMGFKVTGIDFSKRSIEYARDSAAFKRKNIDYIYQNYLNIDYENKFDIITLIYCDFGVLKPLDREYLLRKIKRALKHGGKLILDGFTKEYYCSVIESQKIYYEEKGFWSESPYICIEKTMRYNEKCLFLEQYIIITKTACKCYNNWNCAFDKDTLQNQFKKAGFTKFQFYSDVTGKVFSKSSQTFCIVAS